MLLRLTALSVSVCKMIKIRLAPEQANGLVASSAMGDSLSRKDTFDHQAIWLKIFPCQSKAQCFHGTHVSYGHLLLFLALEEVNPE